MKSFIPTGRVPYSIALVLAYLTLTSGWLRATEARPHCYVLSAGVDNYPYEKKLHGCLNDARNTTHAFKVQQGGLFGRVHAQTLLDASATKDNILSHFQSFSRQGRPGDIMVLFLSGHGGRYDHNKGWFFVPYDYKGSDRANTMLSDRELLDASDVLVKQGKKVVVVIDACFCGQLQSVAQSYFENYRHAEGGLVLLLSSSAEQTSAALGQYSAFAKAFADAMTNGNADLNHDGAISVKEIGQYTYRRTYQLLEQRGLKNKQDSIAVWSPSISDHLALAASQRGSASQQPGQPAKLPAHPARAQDSLWRGSENLSGYGKISFNLLPGGRAVMHDAKDIVEGDWQQNGKQVTLRFYAGRVVYTGILHGMTLRGTAQSDQESWSFNVQRQASSQVAGR